jgi:YegS/Rv2252/BmrU family lipid kinase
VSAGEFAKIDEAPSATQPTSAASSGEARRWTRALIVLNPVAGQSQVETIRGLLEQTLAPHSRRFEIYETTGRDDLRHVVAAADLQPGDLVAAAGGDGTVSQVADALVGRDLVLGILPLGTANVLALELGVPGNLVEAVNLLNGDYELRALDAMRVGDRHFVLQIGVGLDSLMIRDTEREAKRRLGRLAYLMTLAHAFRRIRPGRMTILVDDRRLRPRTQQVVVANGGTLGTPPLRWGPNIAPDDGVLDVCIWNTWTPIHYLRWLWRLVRRRPRQPVISVVPARRQVVISADRPLPIQADGEIIGTTPVQIALVPRAVKTVVTRAPVSA